MVRYVLLLLLVFAGPAWAVPGDPRLDRLFLQLREARSQAEIANLMEQIGRIWDSSGLASIDLLMERAADANTKGAPDIALELLDRLVELAPDYPEAWRRRGAIQAQEGNGEEALSDLREALKLEPRHFGALNEIARILEETGDARGAYEALKRLSELMPFAEGLRQRLQKLDDAAKAQPDPI